MQPPKTQEAVWVGVVLKLDVTQHLRRYPTGAELVPGEPFLVEYQYIHAGRFQASRGRGSRRAATYNDDLGASHVRFLSRIHVSARPRNRVVAPLREEHLEKLQGARLEGSNGTCEVKTPHSHEALIEHGTDCVDFSFVGLEP